MRQGIKGMAARIAAAAGVSIILVSTSAAISCLLAGIASAAPVVLGSWDDGQADGWIDWGGGQVSVAPPAYVFNSTGATLGSGAIGFNETSPTTYTQWLAFKLQAPTANNPVAGRGTGSDANSGGPGIIKDYRPDFMTNTKVAFDLTLVPSEQDPNPSSNLSSLGLIVNGPGWGFNRLGTLIPGDQNDNRYPESVTPAFNGYSPNTNHWNPLQLGSTPQTSTWVFDYSNAKAAMPLDPQSLGGTVPQYVEFIFELYTNGPAVYHIDNFRLFTPAPPAVLDDYNQDGVVNAADYTVWRDHLGQTFALPNRDPANTGPISMADYTSWQARFGATSGAGALSNGGAVPEPATWLLGLIAAVGLLLLRRGR
jgi:hypothetical protein